jgi:hypothetical protein
MGMNSDEWIAAIGSYIRNAFGNRAPMIAPAYVGRVRAASAGRKDLWNSAELEASLPRQLVKDSSWKISASDNTATAPNALSIQPWSSGKAQQAGMWFQIELPQPVTLAEIQFESNAVAPENVSAVPGAPTRTAIGGGRRGAAPGAPAEPAAPPPLGFPRAYQVQVSADGTTWGTPIAAGKGQGASTDITFAPVRAKFIRITQTDNVADAPPWSMQRLRLFEAGAGQGTR